MIRFKVGEHYHHTDWFTGGFSDLVCTENNGAVVKFHEVRNELDGLFITEVEYEIEHNEKSEYVEFYVYKGSPCRLYANIPDGYNEIDENGKVVVYD